MDTFHVSDYVTFAGLIALGVFVWAQISRVETKVDKLASEVKEIANDVTDIKISMAKKEGIEESYSKAKAEMTPTK